MLCFERVDYAAQHDIHVLVCHAVILRAVKRSEESRFGLFCRATAGQDASLRSE
jgi:hypothetical protein